MPQSMIVPAARWRKQVCEISNQRVTPTPPHVDRHYSFVPFLVMGGHWRRYCSRQITFDDRNQRNSPAQGSDV
jgi:hypothetical protein